jgi:hypothetical protein
MRLQQGSEVSHTIVMRSRFSSWHRLRGSRLFNQVKCILSSTLLLGTLRGAGGASNPSVGVPDFARLLAIRLGPAMIGQLISRLGEPTYYKSSEFFYWKGYPKLKGGGHQAVLTAHSYAFYLAQHGHGSATKQVRYPLIDSLVITDWKGYLRDNLPFRAFPSTAIGKLRYGMSISEARSALAPIELKQLPTPKRYPAVQYAYEAEAKDVLAGHMLLWRYELMLVIYHGKLVRIEMSSGTS